MAYREELGQGLILRGVESERDVERFEEFSTKYNNSSEGATCGCLLRYHPHIRWEDFSIVEEEASGRLVSTTCLIPWQCEYEGIPLKAAMLEMVLTHPDYRKLGLIKQQISRFHKLTVEKDYDLNIIWGIPYYYRQYGYTYCMYGNTADLLPVENIPGEGLCKANRFSLRKADESDIPALQRMYSEAVCSQQFHVTRDNEQWYYLLNHALFPVWILEDSVEGRIEGYVIYNGGGTWNISVTEYSILNNKAALELLQILKMEAKETLTLYWPENGLLVKLARSFGSIRQQPGQWLLRIPDILKFITKIRPALEKRLKVSDCRGMTGDLIINMYKQAYMFCFKSGKLSSVESIGFKDASMGADGGDLCIPLDAFVRLLFGFRSLEELTDAWPDIVVRPQSRYLVDTLFPKMTSYIHTPYHYQG